VLGAAESYPAGMPRPEPGPIAILPDARDDLADAVRAGGGGLHLVADDTRGVIWLSAARSAELGALLEAHSGIGWVQLPSAGIDGYAAAFAGRRSDRLPLWTSAKGAFSQPVAEHALMLTLALLRQLPRRARARTWARERDGRSLYGLEVLIVGAGGIAAELLRLLSPFGVRTTVVRRGDREMAGADRTVPVGRLRAVLPTADVVILAAASNRVGEAIVIAQRARGIAVQSIVAGMSLSLLAMAAAALGWLQPVPAALVQEAIDVAVILNALRALR